MGLGVLMSSLLLLPVLSERSFHSEPRCTDAALFSVIVVGPALKP